MYEEGGECNKEGAGLEISKIKEHGGDHQGFGQCPRGQPILRIVENRKPAVAARDDHHERSRKECRTTVEELPRQCPHSDKKPNLQRNDQRRRSATKPKPTNEPSVKRREDCIGILRVVLEKKVAGEVWLYFCQGLHGIQFRVARQALISMGQRP